MIFSRRFMNCLVVTATFFLVLAIGLAWRMKLDNLQLQVEKPAQVDDDALETPGLYAMEHRK